MHLAGRFSGGCVGAMVGMRIHVVSSCVALRWSSKQLSLLIIEVCSHNTGCLKHDDQNDESCLEYFTCTCKTSQHRNASCLCVSTGSCTWNRSQATLVMQTHRLYVRLHCGSSCRPETGDWFRKNSLTCSESSG